MVRLFLILLSLVITNIWAQVDFEVYGGAGVQQTPAAEWNGTYYLVGWENYQNGNIEAQRVQKAIPHLVGSMITVSTSGEYLKVPDMDSDGSRWLLVYEFYDGTTATWAIYSRVVNSNGTLGTESNISGTGGTNNRKYNPGVAFNAGTAQYLSAWKETQDYDIDGRLINADGTPSGTVISDILSDPSYEYSYPRVGSNGTNYLVVVDYNWGSEIRGRIVNLSGVPQGSAISIGSGGFWGTPDVASDGNNYLVVWADGGTAIKGRILDAAGNFITGIFNISDAQAVSPGKPRVDWYEAIMVYQVVWEDLRGSYRFIYGQFVRPDGTLLGQNKKMTWGLNADQSMPVVACGDTNLAAWQDKRNDTNGDIWANLGEGTTGIKEITVVNTEALEIYPNPFQNTLTVDFENTPSSPATLSIYDPSGRLLRKLVSGTGSGVIRWDGRDEFKREVERGIYFLILESQSGRMVGKVVKLGS